jgi:protein-S-isoprenylcysteine O-methyltransferase Ste14
MKRTLALVYGSLAYAFFLATFSYAIFFIGNLWVPKTIDSGPEGPISVAIVVDLALLTVFAVQHSVMARRGFKQWWTRIVPPVVERSTYVWAATLALALILWQWRPMTSVVWDLSGTAAALPLQILSWIGWGILLLSTFLLNHFELFGLAQVWTSFKKCELHPVAFKTPSLYRVVRHPLYLGFVIAFWSAPRMTIGHLVFSIGCTGYILLGIFFEERDLIANYGQIYRDYARRVPMLIPFFKRQPSRNGAKTTTA